MTLELIARSIIFLFSLGLIAWSATRIALQFFRGSHCFWVAVITGYLQISTLTLLTSAFQLLRVEIVIGLQIVLAVAIWLRTDTAISGEIRRTLGSVKDFSEISSRLSKFLVLITVSLILLSLITRIVVPLINGDGIAYVAPRAPYWIQQSQVGTFYIPPNRYTEGSAFSADFLFLWGILFTKAELFGRIGYWLAFPLVATGIYTVMKSFDFSQEVSLLAVTLLVATPVVWNSSLYLQPFPWTLLFSLGAGYWVLQDDQWALVPVAICIGLAASTKQQALALVSGGLLIAMLRTVESNDLRRFAGFTLALLGSIVLSGYFLVSLNNIIQYEAVIHPTVTNSVGDPISLRLLLSKLVRVSFILLRFPIPYEPLNEVLTLWGDRLLTVLGGSTPLYHFWLPKLPREGFGLLGVLTIVSTPVIVYDVLGDFRMRGVAILFDDSRLQYALLASSLLFGSIVMLNVTSRGNSAETYLGPGILMFIPLVFGALVKLRRYERLHTIFLTAVIVYLLAFSGFAGNRAVDNVLATGGSYEVIDHTNPDQYQPAVDKPNPFLCPHPLVNSHVPADGTVIVFSEMKYYLLFGEDYEREVIQVVQPPDNSTLSDLRKSHPDAYLYLTGDFRDTASTKETIENDVRTTIVANTTIVCRDEKHSMWLYRFSDG